MATPLPQPELSAILRIATRIDGTLPPFQCSLVVLSINHTGVWRSLVARLTGGQKVAGSNPVTPTFKSFVVNSLRKLLLGKNHG